MLKLREEPQIKDKLFDQLINEILSSPKDKCFLTGSICFGVQSPGSDYDYVVLDNVFKECIEPYIDQYFIYSGENYAEEDKFKSFKTVETYSLKEYNFIVVNEQEFKVWNAATNFISSSPKWAIKSKGHRVEMFNLLKKIARSYL